MRFLIIQFNAMNPDLTSPLFVRPVTPLYSFLSSPPLQEEDNEYWDSFVHEPIERCSSPALQETENSLPRNAMDEIDANAARMECGDLRDHHLLGKELLRKVDAIFCQILHAKKQSAHWAVAGRCKDFAALLSEVENLQYFQKVRKICTRLLREFGNGWRENGFKDAIDKTSKTFKQLSQAIVDVRFILEHECQSAVAPIQLLLLIQETKEQLSHSREIIENTIMVQDCLNLRFG